MKPLLSRPFYNETSSFIYIEFITEELVTRKTNITIKLNWKLFTKVICTKQKAWVCIDRESLKQCFNLEKIDWESH